MAILSSNAMGAGELFQTSFIPSHPITGPIEIANLKHKSELIFVQYTLSGNKRVAVPFEAKGNKISLRYSGQNEIFKVTLIFGEETKDFNANLPEILSDNVRIHGQWDDLIPLSSGTIENVTDSLLSDTAGAVTEHKVGFKTTIDTLSTAGIIMVTYPPGFVINAIANAEYTDDDPGNDANPPNIASIDYTGNTVYFHLDSLSQQADTASQISIRFWPVTNDTISGSRNVFVQTTRPNGEIDNYPQSSAPFGIVPGSLNHINITPADSLILASDSIVYFSGIGRDLYGNIISGLVFNYDVTIDSCGSISNGIFRALKAGTCYVTLSSGGVTDSSGQITVIPGPLQRFGIDNTPIVPIYAGIPFGGIVITALDNHDNTIIDFADSVWAASNDTNAALPSHQFAAVDSGHHLFSGAPFSLRTKGLISLSFTNGTIESFANPVTVNPGPIYAFAFIPVPNQVAGESFSLQVVNALDSCSNPTFGDVLIFDSIGAQNSPNGFPPILNRISVSEEEGSGSAMQTLTRTGSVILKGTTLTSTHVAVTNSFTVGPGSTDYFTIAGYPDSVTAGASFNNITVSAFDLFGNLQTSFAGPVYFTSNDGNAILPYTAPNPYNWPGSNGGTHSFDSLFVLRTSGIRTISFTNGSIIETTQNIVVWPDSIYSYSLGNPGTVIAGISFDLGVANARDFYGNSASGEVIISGLLNAGHSPSGFSPTLNRISVGNDGTGTSAQILTLAHTNVILQGVANGDTENTGPFVVLPGALNHYTILGFSDTLTAGNTFSGTGIDVEVLDALGNRKTNYNGSVYFVSSDTQAALPYTFASPFSFVNSSYHSFPADSFSLRTSGVQTISITNGTIIDSSQNISVAPGILNSFRIIVPGTDTCGVPFNINVLDAIDSWNNPTGGTIVVSAESGGGSSPDGTPPNFTPIELNRNNGTGSASQTLYNAVNTVLSCSNGVIDSLTGILQVLPGSASRFDFFVNNPQISGVSFSDSASLTAYDTHGNIKHNYDASGDTVVISASNGGQMANNILNSNSDFVDGTANLVSLGTIYSGAGGPVTFTAVSDSGASGTSNPVNFSALFCTGLVIDQRTVSIGETMTGSVDVLNEGGVAVDIENIGLLAQGLNPWQALTIDSTLPNTIPAGGSRSYHYSLIIPEGFPRPNSDMPTTAFIAGAYGGFSVYDMLDTLGGFPDTVEVQTNSRPDYVGGSINRTVLSAGQSYSLSLRLSNFGGAGLGLLDSSYIYFTDDSLEFKSRISTGVYLPPDSAITPAIFDSTLVDSFFIPGDYQALFYCFGMENGIFVADTIPITDSIHIQSRAILSYVENTLNIDSLVAGQNVSLAVNIRNTGTSDFILDNRFTRIHFGDSRMEFIANIDTSTGNRVDTLRNETTLHFERTVLSSDFSLGRFEPVLEIRGSQNGHQMDIDVDTNPDSITVISPCAIRIDSTYSISPNAPFVNEAQQCSIRVVITNLGADGVDSINVNLSQLERATFPDSLLIEHLDGDSSVVNRTFTGIADSVADSGRMFITTLSGGIGSLSRSPASIVQPLDNTALFIVESPANVAMQPIIIEGPQSALDSVISINQEITISTMILNSGQADIIGQRKIALDTTGSGFTVLDSVNRDFNFGQTIVWELHAPDAQRSSSIIRVVFLDSLFDRNDLGFAISAGSAAIEFVVNTAPTISHRALITEPPGAIDSSVSTNQEFTIADYLTPGGIYQNLTCSINLPAGFSTSDSIIKHPTGNFVQWNVRAPSNAALDTISISSWLYGVNLNDSIGTAPEKIPVVVERSSSLRLSSWIAGPSSALDGIVEPGSMLVYRATVINDGQASVGGGSLSLRCGILGLDSVRTFNIGDIIEWSITMPDTEIPVPFPIWTKISSVPTERNIQAPANTVIDSSAISILVKDLLPRLMITNSTSYSGSLVRGQALDFLSLNLKNDDRGGSYTIGIISFSFDLNTNPQVDPSQLFSTLILSSDSGSAPANFIPGNKIEFTLPDAVHLSPSGTLQFTLQLAISTNTTVSDFSLSLSENGIVAEMIQHGGPAMPISVVNSRGDPFTWSSNPSAIFEQSFSASITSYPNPFNPRDGGAKIGYYLGQNSALEIKIFTLFGELVWTKIIATSDPLGQVGMHTEDTAVRWDGKNDSGHEIRSGVYICIIKNLTSNEEKKLKIAVVK